MTIFDVFESDLRVLKLNTLKYKFLDQLKQLIDVLISLNLTILLQNVMKYLVSSPIFADSASFLADFVPNSQLAFFLDFGQCLGLFWAQIV